MRKRLAVWYNPFLAYLILICCVRVGEASNPGPGPPFTVGVINPTGLLGKADHIAALPPGVYGVSETHLSSLGASQFRRELQSHRVPVKFVSSQPAPLIRSSVGVIGGKSTGVGFITHHPGRNLPVQWQDEIQREARTQVAGFCIQGIWIKIGIIYGYAHRPTNLATQNRTDHLLSLVVDRIVNECTGPRIIMGDWNQPYGILGQEKVLSSKGFVEIQCLAKELWNRPILPTCKKSTRKDFMWISPELIHQLIDVSIDEFVFPDHAVLSASFRPFANQEPIYMWPKPSPIPWDEIRAPLPEHPTIQVNATNVDSALVQVMNTMENSAHEQLVKSGKNGLSHRHRGRSRNIVPTKCKHPVPTVPQGRTHDHQPTFLGENFQHYMWLKQLRRLQSLVRLVHSPMTNTHLDHGTKLWEVIRKAPGMPTDFATYWKNRTVVLPGSPCVLPHALPSPAVAMCIHTTFEVEFRQLETTLKSKRSCAAKANRLMDTNKIFLDVAKPRAQPVQTLVKAQVTNVTEVLTEGLTIRFDHQNIAANQPVFGPNGLLQVQEFGPNYWILQQTAHLEPGDTLKQQEPLGRPSEVTREFEALWTSFWGRHLEASADRWKPFVDMFKDTIHPPATPMHMQPISLPQWKKAVRRKKQRSAIGPDGVSRMDLLRMADTGSTALLEILHCIEQGSPWPQSLVVGLISMLEKKEEAETATDYRPICIFSMIYRTWASIRARQILRYLADHAPQELTGNRPRKETADIWWSISLQIESSLFHGYSLAGATADICKCFNALPRVPIMCLAEWMGIPSFFTNGWLRALHTMERRFVINGAVGGSVTSTCGFPEGDPLSVCAMFLTNIALHAFVTSRRPNITTWSFVDDWQIQGNDDQEIEEGMSEVTTFTNMLDLALDRNKSFAWGTTTEVRNGFRARQQKVRLHEKNLGGHISYCKIPTNYTLRDRITAFEPTWTWLKRSRAPMDQKLKIITTVAWPRCLHGIANIPLGAEHFTRLRSRVMQSLAWNKKGANPLIQISLIQGVHYDPGYQAIWITIKAFRRFCIPSIAFPLLDALSQTGQQLRCPGPCGIFLTRIFEVGWSWDGLGLITDHEGIQHHILESAIQVIEQRLRHAWISRIGSQIATREGFHGMSFVSPALTIPSTGALDGEANGLLRTVLNGTFFTRDKQYACGTVPSTLCPFCRQEDSIEHRHYSCPRFQSIRESVPGHVFQYLAEAQPCTIQHGWFCEPEEIRLLRGELAKLPDLTGDFVGHIDVPACNPCHLFCDGSCLEPTVSDLRVATWGVCMANLGEDNFFPLSQGPLPGAYQSSTRAEFTAVISSLKFALHTKRLCWIWTDNQTVHDFLHSTCEVGCQVNPMAKDHDLRAIVLQLSKQAQTANLLGAIMKVRSHMRREAFSNIVEQWAIRGNDFADLCAEKARTGFHPSFWQLWNSAKQQVFTITETRKALHHLFISIGKQVVSLKESIWDHDEKEHANPTANRETEVVDEAKFSWNGIPEDFDFGALAGSGYRSLGSAVGDVHRWMTQLVSSTEGVEQWLSLHQLLILYQAETGKFGIFHRSKQRTFVELTADMTGVTFLETVRDFGTYLRAISKKLQVHYELYKRRPSGTSFQCRPNCLRLMVSARHVEFLDNYFVSRRLAPIRDVKLAFRDFQWADNQPVA